MACSSGGGAVGAADADAATDGARSDGSTRADATLDAKQPLDAGADHSSRPAPLACTPSGLSFSISDAGDWQPTLRVARLSPTKARVVGHRRAAPEAQVFTFDPTASAPSIDVQPLALDYLLDVQKTPTAFDVLGLRVTVPDAGADAGAGAMLVFFSIDDATGAVTEMPLTPPGAVEAPKSFSYYEPPMGRFVRLGPTDVYFAYTVELPPVNNPTYRLSVGRVTGASGPVVPNTVAEAGPHDFEDITAKAVLHVGSSVYLFTGACGVPSVSPSYEHATTANTLILPDDGAVPGSVPSHAVSKELLAVGASKAATVPMAFIDTRNIFGDPRYVYSAYVPEAQLDAITLPGSNVKLANAAVTIGTDVHFEGDDLLMIGPGGGFWYDAIASSPRTSSFEYGPLPNGSSGASVGAITFADKTATTATIDLALESDELWFVEVACAEP
jgi:hypothetical protein